eukprot:355754-Chlamydomonas_euryale.AAC.4
MRRSCTFGASAGSSGFSASSWSSSSIIASRHIISNVLHEGSSCNIMHISWCQNGIWGSRRVAARVSLAADAQQHLHVRHSAALPPPMNTACLLALCSLRTLLSASSLNRCRHCESRGVRSLRRALCRAACRRASGWAHTPVQLPSGRSTQRQHATMSAQSCPRGRASVTHRRVVSRDRSGEFA